MTPRRKLLGNRNRLEKTVMGAVVALVCAAPVWAQDCSALLGLFQQGRSTIEIARVTGLTGNEVEACRRQLSRSSFVGPAGRAPQGAAGPAPVGAAGPPPVGAAGPPPLGAAGRPPVGGAVRRVP